MGQFYIDTVRSVNEIVAKSKMPDLKVYWTEFNTLSTDCAENITFLSNTSVDRLYGASCLVRNMIGIKDYCESVSYWVISDIFEEAQMNHMPFSGTYGLLTIHGIKKAAYNAFLLLKKMRGKIIETELGKAPDGCGVFAAVENGVYRVLLWNNNFPELKDQPVWNGKVDLNLDTIEGYTVEQAKIKKGHGSSYEQWVEMGSPANLTPFEKELLKVSSEMEYTVQSINADGTVDFVLKPDEVIYWEIRKHDVNLTTKKENVELEEKLKTY